MQKFKELIIPAIALFIICLVSAFLVAEPNSLTEEKIAENLLQQKKDTQALVFPNAFFMVSGEKTVSSGKTVEYASANDGAGRLLGYVFTSTSKGYGGDVTVMTAIDINGNVMKSVVLSMDDETPDLGQNAGKTDFLKQFEGKSGVFSWVKNNGNNNEITGVTSATFTSKAVIECVNDAVEAFNMLGGKG